MAGIFLVLLGVARLGNVIKYVIPHPLVIGFTTGIAVIIFSSQVKDFLGLQMEQVPVDFVEKWIVYFRHIRSMNVYALAVSFLTVLIVVFYSAHHTAQPGPLVAILLATLAVQYFHLPVETVGGRY